MGLKLESSIRFFFLYSKMPSIFSLSKLYFIHYVAFIKLAERTLKEQNKSCHISIQSRPAEIWKRTETELLEQPRR